MNKSIVVIIHRDRYSWPKLTVTVAAYAKTETQARTYITNQIMALYEKRLQRKFSPWSRMRVKEYRVVDEMGLKRLQAAAKASVTVRRKRAAKKAAATRAKNALARECNRI